MKVDERVSHLSKGSYDFSKFSPRKVCAEYVWIGVTGIDIRSKTMVLSTEQVSHISELPDWNYDGSSTKQAEGHDSEVFLRPRKMIPDPFRGGNNILVLCDTWKPD